MKRFLAMLLLCVLLLSALAGCKKKGATLYNESYQLFDTICTFYASFERAEDFSAVSHLVKEELIRLDALFDAYEKKSDCGVYAVNEAAGVSPVRVDKDLLTVIELALEIYDITDGAVSPTMGAVTSLWKKATDTGIPPDDTLLKEAGTHIDPTVLQINHLAKTVYLSDPKASVDLGAFAKGYAADRIATLLREKQCTDYLLDLGGNIYAKGNDPQTGLPFLVGVKHPTNESAVLPSVYISEGALVTSGSDQRTFLYNEENYHHIISPQTLYPVKSGLVSVSVLQNSAALADALSTALFVMGREKGESVLETIGGEALFADENGKYFCTDGFSRTAQNNSEDNLVFLILFLLLAGCLALYFYRNPLKNKKTDEQRDQKKDSFSKKDTIFFIGSGVILVICFLVIAFSGILDIETPEVVIRQDGEIVCSLSLSEDRLYRVDQESGYNIIAIEQGEVYMYASDCLNGCCMRSGSINSMHFPAVLVCLPHRLTVSIETVEDTESNRRYSK